MGNRREIVIRLDASYKLKHEKYDGFKVSLFRDVYNLASENVLEIIDTAETDFDYEGENGYTEPSSNLIAFDGKRGSGKTSAMLSFCDFLERVNDYDREACNDVCEKLLKSHKKVSFTVLDCIDATLVTDSRELIGAILGEMLTAIKKRESSNSNMNAKPDVDVCKLRTRLGEIYCSLKAPDTLKEETSPWEVLEQLSRSWNQQQAFKKSVADFNRYMSKNAENYLVIPIDDIDMNLKDGYKLLEAVRKYMMVPNVIVLLAADGNQLETICNEAFCDGIERKGEPGLTRRLALEYLEKLIPSGRRIHMPDLHREENLYEKDVKIQFKDGSVQTVKETIIKKVWKCTGIILNKYDKNSHWLQPNSLRKLSNYVNAMDFLAEEKSEERFFGNLDWFYEDIIKRYFNDERCQHGGEVEEGNLIYSGFDKTIKEFETAALGNKLSALRKGLLTYDFQTGTNRVDAGTEYSYGDLLTMLYKLRQNAFPEVCQAIRFILSLQMRRLVYSFEVIGRRNRDGDEFKEILEFSKGDFWGNMERTSVESQGKSQLKDTLYYDVPIKEQAETMEIKSLLILYMQLDLQEKEAKDEQEKDPGCVGKFQFGNFVNNIFNYKNRINKIIELIQKYGDLNDEKGKQLKNAGDELIKEFTDWEEKYQTSRVIPFDSAELMLHLYDRIYGQGGISHDFDTKDQCVEAYGNAYDVIGEVLEEYDKYFDIKDCELKEEMDDWTRKYKSVYENCPFVKCIKEDSSEGAAILKYAELLDEKKNSEAKRIAAAKKNGEAKKNTEKENDEINAEAED